MISLAVKYRPKTFQEVVSQDSIKEILSNQIETGEFKNAYLFCGGAGTGKTTTARIVANDMNQGKGSPIEIDGASNNGVDNIREIIDKCKSKSLNCKYKVFIIDEVHMLSIGAFNALLKTLEEPPQGSIFILCTTDPQKIPGTILSRVQRFDFKRIPAKQIVDRLVYIIDQENSDMVNNYVGGKDGVRDMAWALNEGIPVIEYDIEALEYIAKLADGGMRDSITMLDKVLGFTSVVDLQSVVEALGETDYGLYFDLLQCIRDGNALQAIRIVSEAHMNGKDLKLFMRGFTNMVLDVIKYKLTEDLDMTALPSSYQVDLDAALIMDEECLVTLLDDLNRVTTQIKWESNPRPIIEAEMILLCRL